MATAFEAPEDRDLARRSGKSVGPSTSMKSWAAQPNRAVPGRVPLYDESAFTGSGGSSAAQTAGSRSTSSSRSSKAWRSTRTARTRWLRSGRSSRRRLAEARDRDHALPDAASAELMGVAFAFTWSACQTCRPARTTRKIARSCPCRDHGMKDGAGAGGRIRIAGGKRSRDSLLVVTEKLMSEMKGRDRNEGEASGHGARSRDRTPRVEWGKRSRSKEGKEGAALRLGVEGGGCSGFSYFMDSRTASGPGTSCSSTRD
jgi:hypothetical protein